MTTGYSEDKRYRFVAFWTNVYGTWFGSDPTEEWDEMIKAATEAKLAGHEFQQAVTLDTHPTDARPPADITAPVRGELSARRKMPAHEGFRTSAWIGDDGYGPDVICPDPFWRKR